MKIPFVNLKAQYNSIKEEIDTAINNVIQETNFIKGHQIDTFEQKFAEKLGIKHCISCGNGTDAIYASLKMLNIGFDDEVITAANSWISTSETISQTGAKPVFIDIDKYSSIDVSKIEEKITAKTKAIIVVHLYGLPTEIDKIQAIVKKHNLFLIEDCAQAHFAKFNKKYVGTFGDIATYSFYPGKNLGAYGDAGAIVTNNRKLAEKVRMFINHGALQKHLHKIEGINSRMDTIQAAILNVKLKYIDKWNEMRIQNASIYNNLLSEINSITLPPTRKETLNIYHVYSIKTRRRDELQKKLLEKGIATAIHYPVALPFMEAYKYLNYSKKDFPVATKFQNEILSLPMYPELSFAEIKYIANSVKEILSN